MGDLAEAAVKGEEVEEGVAAEFDDELRESNEDSKVCYCARRLRKCAANLC